MDRRKVKTREAIIKAYLDLITEKGTSQVTISELARRANIDRKTFYLHYNSADDVLSEYVEQKFNMIVSVMEENHYFDSPFDVEMLIDLLDRFYKEEEKLLLAAAGGDSYDFWIKIHDILADKTKDLYAPLESAFIENGDQMDYAKFFTLLNDYKEWKNSKGEPIKAWKAMVEYFCPDDYASRFGDNFENNNGTTRKQNIVQKTLNFFGLSEKNEEGEKKDDPTHQGMIGDSRTKTYYKSSSFISDKHCWDFIKTLVPENLHKEVNKDLKWFQEEYEKGDKSQYYARASRENQATIDAFIRYLAKKKYASSLNIQSIGNYLRRIYVR